jgi:hypothetical protein
MKKPFSIVLRILGVLLLLAIVGGGAFRFGYTRGVADSPAIAKQMESWQANNNTLPAPYAMHGYPGPWMQGGYAPYWMPRGHFGFNPLAGLLGLIFFAFLFFGTMRMLFFRRMLHHHGPWQGHMPPWAQQAAPQAPAQPETPQEDKK